MGMKVALLHYTAPPVVGGVESVLAHHARLMAGAGHAVTILAARGAPLAANVGFVHLPLADSRHPDILAAKAQLDAGQVPADFAAQVEQLSTDLQTAAAGMDVLIAHNVCSLNKNLALTAALHHLSARPGFPRLILWHHDLAWTTPRYLPELHAGYPWDLLRTDWPGVTHVVVSAERRRELAELLRLAPARIRVVPNGIDLATFLKLETATTQLLAQTGVTAAAPLLLLPVRITPRKNIELAVRVIAELRAAAARVTRPEMRHPMLVVTGPLGPHNPANGAYFDQLRALRQELGLARSVVFLAEHQPGYLPDPVIADFFRLADALFLPSREEGFGIPMLEAAFSRRPIFCADIPALRELGGAEATYFSPDADPAVIAASISQALSADPAYRFAVRARAAFTWERIYAEHLAPLLTEART